MLTRMETKLGSDQHPHIDSPLPASSSPITTQESGLSSAMANRLKLPIHCEPLPPAFSNITIPPPHLQLPWNGWQSPQGRVSNFPGSAADPQRFELHQQGFPKLELPFFSGDNPHEWVRKADRFFDLHNTADQHRLEMAELFLREKAEVWYHGWVTTRPGATWKQFTAALCKRFTANPGEDVLEALSKVSQTGTVADYLEKFEELKALAQIRLPIMPESFWIAGFISGLKEEIRAMVKISRSVTLEQAIEVAGLQESALGCINRGWKQSRPLPRPSPPHIPQVDASTIITKQPSTVLRIPQADLQLKRKQGLCFKCDDKYFVGHVCKNKTLNVLIIDSNEDEITEVLSEEDSDSGPAISSLEISVHALSGQTSNSVVRISGKLGQQPISILIDSGSTHSFIEEKLATHFRLPLMADRFASVTVANGEKLQSQELAAPVTWTMLDIPFSFPLRTLRFRACDIILGIDWMTAHSPVTFLPPQQQIQIHYEGGPLTIPYSDIANFQEISSAPIAAAESGLRSGVFAEQQRTRAMELPASISFVDRVQQLQHEWDLKHEALMNRLKSPIHFQEQMKESDIQATIAAPSVNASTDYQLNNIVPPNEVVENTERLEIVVASEEGVGDAESDVLSNDVGFNDETEGENRNFSSEPEDPNAGEDVQASVLENGEGKLYEEEDPKKALFQIVSRLHDNSPRSQHLLTFASSNGYSSSVSLMASAAGASIRGLAPLMSKYGGYKGDSGNWPRSLYSAPRDEAVLKEFSFCMVCPVGNIGSVMGKGSAIINQIRQESGAGIKVNSSTTEGDDCLINIPTKEIFENNFSPTLEAVVRLLSRCSEKVERDSGIVSFTTRLLVQTSRIGCLIGKGGAIITEMRRLTKANIRILSKENLPKIASEDEEMVQIAGELDVAKDALIQVATRLRANLFDKEGALQTMLPVLPYLPMSANAADSLNYESRDGKRHGRGHSFSSGYGGSSEVAAGDGYGSYGSPQAAVNGSGYGAYGSYSSGRSGSPRMSGHNPASRRRNYGY